MAAQNDEKQEVAQFDLLEAKMLYDHIVDSIRHEDNLVNNRMNWLIAVESFAVASLAITQHSKQQILVEVISQCLSVEEVTVCAHYRTSILSLDVLSLLLCVFGLGLSWVSIRAINAAHKSVFGRRVTWENYCVNFVPPGHEFDEPLSPTGWEKSIKSIKKPFFKLFPYPTGGGVSQVTKSGNIVSSGFASISALFWLLGLVFIVISGWNSYNLFLL